MSYQIFLEEHGIYTQHSGIPSDADIWDVAHEYSNLYRSNEIRYILSDYLNCDGVSFSPTLAKELADSNLGAALNNDAFKIAIVANDLPDLLSMISDYVQSSLPSYEIRLFSELNEARNWCEN